MCAFCSVSISLNMGYRLNVRDLNVIRYTVKPFPNQDVSITLILNLDKIRGGLAIVLISAPLTYLVQDNWTMDWDICVMSMA